MSTGKSIRTSRDSNSSADFLREQQEEYRRLVQEARQEKIAAKLVIAGSTRVGKSTKKNEKRAVARAAKKTIALPLAKDSCLSLVGPRNPPLAIQEENINGCFDESWSLRRLFDSLYVIDGGSVVTMDDTVLDSLACGWISLFIGLNMRKALMPRHVQDLLEAKSLTPLTLKASCPRALREKCLSYDLASMADRLGIVITVSEINVFAEPGSDDDPFLITSFGSSAIREAHVDLFCFGGHYTVMVAPERAVEEISIANSVGGKLVNIVK